MGNEYTKQDTNGSIANGNVIDADDLNAEFNTLDDAFNGSTGHTHDGTTGEGGPVSVIGPAQDIVATNAVLRPKTTNVIDLGTTALKYKDFYLEGNADIDGTINVEGATTLQSTLAAGNTTITGNLTVSGDATISGNLTFGDATTDTITLTADVASHILPSADDTYDLGATGSEWRDLYIDGTANIDTAAIGALSVSGDGTITGNLTINGNTTLGNAATDTVTVTADIASSLIPSADDIYDLGASDSEWRNAYIDGTAYIDTADIGTLSVSGNGTVTGDLTVNGTINATVTGSSSTANALTTARTISLSGDVTGSVDFDGSSNVTLTATVVDDSHSHIIGDVDGLQTALNAKAPLADPTFTGTLAAPTINASTALQIGGTPITATATQINYVDGVTSAIQTQLDAKMTPTYTGNVDITGELVVDSYNETYAAITSSSGTATIDCEAGNVFALTLSENVTTFTWSNPPTSGTAYGFSLKVIQGSSDYTISWPTSVDWPESTAPILTSGSGAVDQFVFYTHDGGTTWYGFRAGKALG